MALFLLSSPVITGYPGSASDTMHAWFPVVNSGLDLTNGLTHLFDRPGKSSGKGPLFHARIAQSSFQEILDPEYSEVSFMRHYRANSKVERMHALTQGCSPWMMQKHAYWYGEQQAIAVYGTQVYTVQWRLEGTVRVTRMRRVYHPVLIHEPTADQTYYLYSLESDATEMAREMPHHGHLGTPAEWILKAGGWNPAWLDHPKATRASTGPTPYPMGLEAFSFKYGEGEVWDWMTQIGKFGSSRVAAGLTSAFYDAVGKLPTSDNLNSIQNVLEVASTLADLIKKPSVKTLVGDVNLRNTWLRYRYQYQTTKSDVAEYVELTERLCNLATATILKVHGLYRENDAEYGATVTYAATDFLPSTIRDWLGQYGLSPTIGKVWDMIPYSFMVDWFVDISGFLEQWSLAQRAVRFTPLEMWYTMKTTYDTADGTQNVFVRVPATTVPRPFPKWEMSLSGGKTWLMRLADAAAIFSRR